MTEVGEAAQDAARRKLRKIAADRHKAVVVENEAIAVALRLGVKQVDVMQDVDRSREHVRKVARAAGIKSNRPPTAGRRSTTPAE